MDKKDFFVSMDDTLKNGLHTPGNLPATFDWRFFDSIPELIDLGTRGRLDHSYYLYHYASVLPKNSLILEIGTLRGASAIAMGMGLRASDNKNSRIITIDPGLAPRQEIEKRKDELSKYELQVNDLDKVFENLQRAGLEHYISIVPDTSENVLKRWDGRSIDMIHIDGSHKYEDVKVDCQWLQYIRKGGVAVFDDWFDPVQRAAKEYFANKPEWQVLTLSTDQPTRHPWKTVFWKN